IAILGVLAVIMVPAFTGYIAKAEKSNVLSGAKSYCTAYQAAFADLKAEGAGTLTIGEIDARAEEVNVEYKDEDYKTYDITVSRTADGVCTVGLD
ncbi:MAG: hypothetical protein ACRDCA_25320, partial [Serratia sp. (in: enterobacteria)]|uniref:hypothetical protein n=1 Tax=Serratia sp. (in: enterobacteria) TaxID=616 RepID=UPI003F33D0CF